jgi:hypothetical protein
MNDLEVDKPRLSKKWPDLRRSPGKRKLRPANMDCGFLVQNKLRRLHSAIAVEPPLHHIVAQHISHR